MPDNCHGKSAQDLVILVPPGTLILDRDRKNVLRDLTAPVNKSSSPRAAAAAAAIAPSCLRPTGRGETQPGVEGRGALDRPGTESHRRRRTGRPAQRGQVHTVESFVAGPCRKSATTRSRPSDPNLGIVSIGGERAFVLADLPGLIEGASQGVGLGHEFLRHVERTRVLVHLVEPLPTDGSDPLQNYRTIRRELELYRPELAAKPEVVAVSKAELTGAAEVRERMEQELGREVLAISAVTGEGLSRLVRAVVECLAGSQAEAEVRS